MKLASNFLSTVDFQPILARLPVWMQNKVEDHPKEAALMVTGISLLGIHFLYSRYQSNLKQFDINDDNLKNIGILITGCDTGFGNKTAKKLNKLGYCVIATCYTDKGVNEFNNDLNFTQNGSFATNMDVTNLESIKKVKQIVENWLNENENRIFWAVVNNAGTIYYN